MWLSPMWMMVKRVSAGLMAAFAVPELGFFGAVRTGGRLPLLLEFAD